MPNFGVADVVSVVLLLSVIASVSPSQPNSVCPRKFVPIGKKCYHFSKDEASWNDAHFKCSALNSTLATITRSRQEFLVRRYLNRHGGRHERWLGGMFNDKKLKWVWGQNGKQLEFQAFSRMRANDQMWAWHCIIVDPARQYKWNARSCVVKRRYICLKPSPYRKKNFNGNKNCKNNSAVKASGRNCTKSGDGQVAPGFLIMPKKKKVKPYKPATFICPSHMILVGRKCYFFSLEEANWSDAYWACRDNKSKLANIMSKMEDNILRGFLNGNFTEKHERWIGGIYDWKQKKWKWAMSGRIIRYKHFARAASENTNHTQHCITLDPQYKHLWNSKNRLERRHYICQAKAKSVVKVDKYEKYKALKPDATVVIELDSNDIEKNYENATTEASTVGHKNAVTDRYIYNS